jgi:hypothetical protein
VTPNTYLALMTLLFEKGFIFYHMETQSLTVLAARKIRYVGHGALTAWKDRLYNNAVVAE